MISINPGLEEKIIELVRDVAIKNGVVARIVGGWVRDRILGISSKDIDITVEGASLSGLDFANCIRDHFKEHKEKYIDDLVRSSCANPEKDIHVTVIEEKPEQSKHLETETFTVFGEEIDIVALRKEVYLPGSRIPIIEPATSVEDAHRRDFTINALFYNIVSGELEDLTGQGLDDFKRKIIRTPLDPHQTFKDDPLRMLRGFRLLAKLDEEWSISPDVMSCFDNEELLMDLLLKVSHERVGQEFMKVLGGKNYKKSLVTMLRHPRFFETIFWSKVPSGLEEWIGSLVGEHGCVDLLSILMCQIVEETDVATFSEHYLDYLKREIMLVLKELETYPGETRLVNRLKMLKKPVKFRTELDCVRFCLSELLKLPRNLTNAVTITVESVLKLGECGDDAEKYLVLYRNRRRFLQNWKENCFGDIIRLLCFPGLSDEKIVEIEQKINNERYSQEWKVQTEVKSIGEYIQIRSLEVIRSLI